MKATIELPNELYRRIKAAAALQGRPLKELVGEALREKLDALEGAEAPGWRQVFGAARREMTVEVDAIVSAEFETIDPDTWL